MICVRPATLDDLGALKELLFYLHDQAPWEDDQQAEKTLQGLVDNPERLILIGILDSNPAGTLGLTFTQGLTRDLGSFAIIDSLVVAPESRRQGAAAALLREAVDQAKARSCYKIEVISADHRSEAHRLYVGAGFDSSTRGFRRYL